MSNVPSRKKMELVSSIAQDIRSKAEKLYDDCSELCGFASYEIFCAMQKAGLQPIFASNRQHAFIMWEGYIVDVTATQFSRRKYPKIIIKKRSSIKKIPDFWEIETLCKSRSGMTKSFKGWPEEQRPWSVKREMKSLEREEKRLGTQASS
jgi:hypothetical protein